MDPFPESFASARESAGLPALSVDALTGVLTDYAALLHADVALSPHHVASPLGAWLLVALMSTSASEPVAAELRDILGSDPETAARTAALLLSDPPPVLRAALACWVNALETTPELEDWMRALPALAPQGPLPSQEDADEWAREGTEGVISKFPLTLTPDTSLVLTDALAVKTRWHTPFGDNVPLPAGSPWEGEVEFLMRSDTALVRLLDTPLGRVGVHCVRGEGLSLYSLIADPEVPSCDLLVLAHEIARAGWDVHSPSKLTHLAGFPFLDPSVLPLGAEGFVEVGEETIWTSSPGEAAPRYRALLPAWEAESRHEGATLPGLALAATGLGARLRSWQGGATPGAVQVVQAALARCTRTGFEAAAVTAAMVMAGSSMMAQREVRVRTCTLRFLHPYVFVAAVEDTSWERTSGGGHWVDGRWHRLPVFSGRVATPVSDPDTLDLSSTRELPALSGWGGGL